MGTDAGTPGNHHGRMRAKRVDGDGVGMRPQESIYCATANPAKLCARRITRQPRRRQVRGLIGCRADPLADITELTRIAFVMKGGTIYKDELTQ